MSGVDLRRTDSVLSVWERPLLGWLAARLPAWVTPDSLTAVGFAGALLCLGGYALAAHTAWGLLVASLGLVVNWFGDSLDGTLARHRRIERPRYGYVLDNGLDMVEQLLLAIGVGLSGYVRWELCFFSLSVLFMMSSLSAIQARVRPVHTLAYGGLGLTELRLGGLAMNALLAAVPPSRLDFLGLPMSYPDLIALIWSVATLLVFATSLTGQVRELAREEPPRRPRRNSPGPGA